MPSRIRQVISDFSCHKIDALLITHDIDITYLTGFPASESWLLILSGQSFYITDARYVLEAKKSLRGVSVICYQKSIYSTLFDLVVSRGKKVKALGFDGRYLSVAQFKCLKKVCSKGIKLKQVNGIIDKFREIKDSLERKMIGKALGIHKQAHLWLKKIIKPGVSEAEVYQKLDKFVRSKKAEFSFPPIIASGSNSCYPHARITRRKFHKNDVILVDMGIDWKGYKSDLTRMFFLGKIPNLVREVESAVRQAQELAIKGIRSGIAVAEIDHFARNYLANKGLAKYFNHSLGHGVGLEIHESPRLSKMSKEVLKEGMVVTVEPAVYLPHKFGIRIEDMVYVKENGCELLSGRIY